MYSVADALIKLKNASLVSHKETTVRRTKLIEGIMKILLKEGFVSSIEVNDGEIVVGLKYNEKKPMITDVKIVSTPGHRQYQGHYSLQRVLKGRGVGIISTSAGLLTVEEAKSRTLGGEYICKVW